MKKLTYISLFMVLMISNAEAASKRVIKEEPSGEIVVEVAGVKPFGDLARDFNSSYFGFGATGGSELGFRYRHFLSSNLSIAPAFHFLNYRSLEGVDVDFGEYEIHATSYRYTVELMFMDQGSGKKLRPFVAMAAGLFRNRLVGHQKNFSQPIDTSVNSLGITTRVGLRIYGLELSAVYNVNRFHAWRFFDTGFEELYNWDSLSFRGGWRFPI